MKTNWGSIKHQKLREARRERITRYILVIVLLSFSSFGTGCVHQNANSEEKIYTDLKNEQLVEDLQMRLRVNPTDNTWRYQLVKIFWSEYLFDDAIEQLEVIIGNEPDDIRAYQMLALTLIKSPRTDYEGAATVLEKAIEFNPGSADLHAHLCLVYSEFRRSDKAKQECHKALQLSTSKRRNASIFLVFASLDQQQTKYYYQKAIELDPTIEDRDNAISNIPAFVGERPFFIFRSHPSWKHRLRELDQLTR